MSFPEGNAALRAASLLDRQPLRPRRSPSRTAAIEPPRRCFLTHPQQPVGEITPCIGCPDEINQAAAIARFRS